MLEYITNPNTLYLDDTYLVPRRLAYKSFDIFDVSRLNILAILRRFFRNREIGQDISELVKQIEFTEIPLSLISIICDEYSIFSFVFDDYFERRLQAEEVLIILLNLRQKAKEKIEYNIDEQVLIEKLESEQIKYRYKVNEGFNFNYLLVSAKEYWEEADLRGYYYSFEMVKNVEIAIDFIYNNRSSFFNKCYSDDYYTEFFKKLFPLNEVENLKTSIGESAYGYLEKVLNGEYNKCYQSLNISYFRLDDFDVLPSLSSVEWLGVEKETLNICKLETLPKL